MKFIYACIAFQFYCSFAFSQKPLFDSYLIDSINTHANIKLTSYPFLIPKDKSNLGGSFALGPCVSLSGKRIEIQLGILYDFHKYEAWNDIRHFSPVEYVQYHKWYLPIIFNYYFKISKRIKCFPSFGGGVLTSGKTDDSRGWIFVGVGICYKISEKIKLSTTIHERNSSDGLSQGAFFEIAYQLK